MPVDNLRELCLWPTDGRRGWKRHCLQSNTYLALEIARTGSASACMWACVKEQPARERKQKPLIKITPRRWPLTPILKNVSPLFRSLYRTQCEVWSVQWILPVLAADATPPSLPSPAKPILRFMSPSHYYLHICQHSLYAQEATSHTYTNVCMCVRRRAWTSIKICVFIPVGAQKCVCEKSRGKCLLYIMLETNNLDRERRKEGDLAEPCEGDERVVMWSPFGAPPHQNKPCEQCLLGKRFATAEAVTSTICHLQITCHTQTDTSLCPVSFCLVSTHTQAYTCSLLSVFSLLKSHTHMRILCLSKMQWHEMITDQLDSSEYTLHLTFPQSPSPRHAARSTTLKQTASLFCSLIIFRHTHVRTHAFTFFSASACSIVLAFFNFYEFFLHIRPPAVDSTCLSVSIFSVKCVCVLVCLRVCVCMCVCVFLAPAAEDVGVCTDAQSDN